jgi:hypothetical protein
MAAVSTKKRPGSGARADTGSTSTASGSTDTQADGGFGIEDSLAELWAVIESGSVLDAEVHVAGMLALPALNRSSRAVTESYISALISQAARMRPRSSAAVFYRLLMTLGSPSVKKMASGALRELTSAGVYPPGWVTEIGRPAPGEAMRRRDVFGDDEVVIVTFSYGDGDEAKRHAVLVVVDRTVLPVAVTVGVSPDPDALIESVNRPESTVAGNAAGSVEQVSLADARQLVEGPMARAAQGGSRGLSPSSATFLPVALSHVRRLPGEGAAEAAAYGAADRAAAVAAFLASPHAAEAGEEDVARFWAQALTGYSGRIAGEPPAQVGPRKLPAMLGHVASTFELTGAQRAGMPAAVTAWARWACGHNGLDEAATERVLTAAAEALEEFGAAYDNPAAIVARSYVSDLATGDADVTGLAEAVTRRSVAVPFPDSRDGSPGMDVTDPAARADMVAQEFASCALDEGQTRDGLIDGARRAVEELWAGEPAATWEAARKLLTEGRSRHDAIHVLVKRAGPES